MIHLDTDLGTNIDDLCGLAMILRWPGAELIAVTTNLEQGGRRAGYVRYVLNLAGRGDIPVAAGADASPMQRRRVPLPDEIAYWRQPILPAPGSNEQALSLLRRSIEQGAAIVAIGAYTNLALLERQAPGILSRAHLYLMGGYVFPAREGYPALTNEMDTNVQVDVESSQLALQAANPTLIPLSVTVETFLRRSYLPALRRAGPLGELISHQAELYAQEHHQEARYGQVYARLPDGIISFQHDPLACAIALGWREGVEITEVPLATEIRDGWLHERVDSRGKPTKVVTRVDGQRFSELWLQMIAAP